MNKHFAFKYHSYDGQQFDVRMQYNAQRYDYQVYWRGDNVTFELSAHELRDLDAECESIIGMGLGLSLVIQESA